VNFRLGAERYQAGDYRGALALFLASQRLVPNRNVRFNIVRTFQRLGMYPEAYRWCEEALHEETDPAMRAKCLNVINGEARRLERIVGEMLSVAEMEAGSFKLKQDDVRLDALFEELKADYESQAKEKRITLAFNLSPKLPVLQGDRDKVALAVHNLIGNALKYTPDGGRVLVTVDADARHVSVSVKDTGIGISPEDQERIFERFYRAKDKRVARITGTGLGLTLAREVARLHGGEIEVESVLNQGSTFTLTLPVKAEAA